MACQSTEELGRFSRLKLKAVGSDTSAITEANIFLGTLLHLTFLTLPYFTAKLTAFTIKSRPIALTVGIYAYKMTSWVYDYFNVSFPCEGVAHVEVNRPEKLNAWIEQ